MGAAFLPDKSNYCIHMDMPTILVLFFILINMLNQKHHPLFFLRREKD